MVINHTVKAIQSIKTLRVLKKSVISFRIIKQKYHHNIIYIFFYTGINSLLMVVSTSLYLTYKLIKNLNLIRKFCTQNFKWNFEIEFYSSNFNGNLVYFYNGNERKRKNDVEFC